MIRNIILSLFVFGIGFIISCSKSSDSTAVTSAYQGAGSRWTASFTAGNFVITKYPDASSTTAELTVNGTYIDYSNKIRLLTVTSATGTSAPSAGAQAYGIEIPGFAFILKPMDADSEPIAMVAAGSCPTASFTSNWIATDFESGNTTDDTQDAFGTATFTLNGASSSADISKFSFETASLITPNSSLSFDSANCSGGVLDVGGGVSMYLTTASGALVSTPTNKIFAAPAQTSDFTQAAAAGTYTGIAFVSDAATKQIPVKIVIPATGNGSGAEITDIAADTTAADSLVFSNFAAIASTNGLFRADATLTPDSGKINCAIFNYGGVNVIGCNGFFKADGGDYDGDTITAEKIPFFVIARSR